MHELSAPVLQVAEGLSEKKLFGRTALVRTSLLGKAAENVVQAHKDCSFLSGRTYGSFDTRQVNLISFQLFAISEQQKR